MFRLVLALALLAAAPAWADDGDKLRQHQAELERVRSRIEAVARDLEKSRGQQDALRRSVEDSEKALAEAQAQVRRTRAQIEAQRGRVLATQDEQRKAQGLLAQQKDALARQVRAAYIIGKQGQAKLLLSQGDAHRIGRVLTYYDYLNRARTTKIRSIAVQAERIGDVSSRLKQEAEALVALRQQQEAELVLLQGSRARRGETLRKLQARIASAVEELAQLQQNEKDIRSLLDSLQDALADIPLDLGKSDRPFPALKGKLPWPIRGKLLAAYGQPKAGGRMSWNGYWINAPDGAPVKSVARGRVAYVGWMQRYGLIIVIEHDAGYFSLYGHNQSVAKSVGDWVNAGEIVAAAGNSGGYDQTGVYFEVRKGTQPLDPKSWLGR